MCVSACERVCVCVSSLSEMRLHANSWSMLSNTKAVKWLETRQVFLFMQIHATFFFYQPALYKSHQDNKIEPL